MYIHPETGTLYLDPGETYVKEVIDPEGTNRLATIIMPNGMEIQMRRSYAHIRPDVFDHEGNELWIELDRDTHDLRVRGIANNHAPDNIKAIKAKMFVNKLQKISDMLGYRAQSRKSMFEIS